MPIIRAIVWGGLTVGILDGLDAIVFYGLRGIRSIRIAMQIASAVLGPEAFRGESGAIALGVFLHFAVALTAAAIYCLASLRLPLLLRHAVLCGAVYGIAFYFVMNYGILPLTAVAAPRTLPALPILLNGLLAHIFLVGLPIALIARSVLSPRRRAYR